MEIAYQCWRIRVSGSRDAGRRERVAGLARSVVGNLPPERLVAHELDGFDANAAAWAQRRAAAPGREGASGFGPDSLVPEATQLALMAAQAAIQVMVEGGLHSWWDRRRERRRERTKLVPAGAAPLSAAQAAKVHAAVVDALIDTGVSRATACLFADTIVASLNQTAGEPVAD